ncbi:EF-Tu/IF-2/RF-3 family GTPase [Streptomyces albireticuli]|uniref:Elongation factor Tu n=1 Tax=Streptomyces albireticuli TaxID=1940 RepID=A0A2A2D3T0_9ACTN|nr:EF-Tu/IF-2/RF-3 family GTPase [Streptomyces albireticuli]MCD9144382.1 elongation factor Tu [Streptomyces albireticuli]MCD9163555.1 elongation factor Tu [Streptomyces albireticuli]MCD9193059.1 elongation factor Tu [Streptomyces albireticuli]PAU46059.1 elongation factor Tu [Streptomyces albireticuli]
MRHEHVEYAGEPGSGTSTLRAAVARLTAPAGERPRRLPPRAPAEKTLISHRPAGLVLVLDAGTGMTARGGELLDLARRVGVRHVSVFVNKSDLLPDPELREVLRLEIRESLSAHGYAGGAAPIVFGSARGALAGDTEGTEAVEALLRGLDPCRPGPDDDTMNHPFLMPVEDTFHLKDRPASRRLVVTGRVERGRVRPGDVLEVVGLGEPGRTVTVTAVERFRESPETAAAGDNAGLVLGGTTPEAAPERGQVLTTPGTASAHTSFEAEAYVLPEDDGGLAVTFSGRPEAQFHFRTTAVTGRITTLRQAGAVRESTRGGHVSLTVRLTAPLAMETGTPFSMRVSGKAIGPGVVTRVVA